MSRCIVGLGSASSRLLQRSRFAPTGVRFSSSGGAFDIQGTLKTGRNNAAGSLNNAVIVYALASLKINKELLDGMEDAVYTRKLSLYGASIGAHVRHILDHYSALLLDRDDHSAIVNYDNRKRGTEVETSRLVALQRNAELMAAIENLQEVIQLPDRVRVSFMSSEKDSLVLDSNISRELAFCTHHATHHFSVIKLMLLSIDEDTRIPAELGLAVATKNFNKSQKSD